jgi:arylsulfatase A-like enzyme
MSLPVLLLAAALARPSAAETASPVQNVLLIVVDAMRQDRLSAYGNPRRTSPTLDALAGDGALFLNVETQSNWTLPALASIMTSLQPSVHGALKPPAETLDWTGALARGDFRAEVGGKLDATRPTLAGVLSGAGWTTRGIVSGGFCRSEFGIASGFQSFQDTGVKLEELNDRYILPWIKEHRGEKFFLYVHAGDVHSPYGTTPPFDRLWDPDYKGSVDGSRATLAAVRSGERKTSARDLRHILALYDGGITYTDAQIARIVAELKQLDLYRRTLIIVTSDHGESFLEHPKVMLHGRSAYETELRVPLIMRVPGRKPGVKVAPVARSIDIAPTVLEALGVPAPATFQGVSDLALVGGGKAPASTDEAAFSLTADLPRPRAALAVREGRWKMLRPEAGKAELYDLDADPGEKSDLARSHPEIAARLGRDLDARIKLDAAAAAALPPLSGDPPVAEELRAKLRAEGYLK